MKVETENLLQFMSVTGVLSSLLMLVSHIYDKDVWSLFFAILSTVTAFFILALALTYRYTTNEIKKE